MKNLKLTWGQITVLGLAATPMTAVGIAGAVATYVNMSHSLHSGASAMGMVAAGEGAVLVAALVALAVTLMGQHTPVVARVAMWVLPIVASVAGVLLADSRDMRVAMAVTPLAMTAAGEGVAFVARRVVAYRTGVDLEQQRRSGLLLWHANRAANGGRLGKRISKAAVWRLTRKFAETDAQMSVQLGEVQRFRIGEGADINLARVLSGSPEKPAVAPAEPVKAIALPAAPEAPSAPVQPQEEAEDDDTHDDPAGYEWIKSVINEGAANVKADTAVQLLTTAQVAEIKGVKTATVRSWVHRGKLSAYDTVGGKPLYHPADLVKVP